MCCDLHLDEYARLDRLEERSALVVRAKMAELMSSGLGFGSYEKL